MDAEHGVCASCGLRLGQGEGPELAVSPPPSELEDGDGSSWADPFEPPGSASPVDAAALDRMQRALELTGVTEVGRSMAKVLPVQCEGVDLQAAQLTPFEGYLLSLVDGTTSVHDIMAMSGLSLFEAVTAFSSLNDKGVITIEEDASLVSVPPPVPEPEGPAALGKLALRQRAVAVKKPRVVESDPDILVEQAEQAVQEGALPRAGELVRLALVYAPNSERALALKQQLHDPQHARTRAKVLHGLAMRSYEAGQFASAVQLLEASLEEDAGSATVHHRMGLALARAGGGLDRAVRFIERAVELAPDSDKYRRNLERVRAQRSG